MRFYKQATHRRPFFYFGSFHHPRPFWAHLVRKKSISLDFDVHVLFVLSIDMLYRFKTIFLFNISEGGEKKYRLKVSLPEGKEFEVKNKSYKVALFVAHSSTRFPCYLGMEI